jgi:hypothetical protein
MKAYVLGNVREKFLRSSTNSHKACGIFQPDRVQKGCRYNRKGYTGTGRCASSSIQRIQSTASHQQAAVATIGQARIVGHQHQCRACVAAQIQQQIDHLLARILVQVAGRLIGEQDFRPGREGAGDSRSLLLTAGELPRIVARAPRETDTPEGLEADASGICHTVQLQGQKHVFQCGQGGQELEVLEHEPYAALAQGRTAVFVESAQALPTQPDLTAARSIQAREKTEQGRLARSGRTQNG